MGFDCQKCIDKKICQGDCCGAVPINSMSWKLHRGSKDKKAKIVKVLRCDEGVIPITNDGKCVFLDRETFQCKIYNYRPQVCRDFGVKPSGNCFLDCPYQKSDGTLRTKKELDLHLKVIDERSKVLMEDCEKLYHK